MAGLTNITAHLAVLLVLTASTMAVFYTKSSETDYPRIGRRSWYTTGSGKHYPRMGRRAASGATTAEVLSKLLPGSPGTGSSASTSGGSASSVISPSTAAAAFTELAKRGVFTQGSGGYPRVGRRSGPPPGYVSSRRSRILDRLAQLREERRSIEEEEEDDEMPGDIGGEDNGSGVNDDDLDTRPEISLDIMFIAFDTNGDGALSKAEFTSGMRKYREQSLLC